MKYDLRAMWAQRKPRKRTVTFRPVTLPAMLATDLYQSAYALIIAEWSASLPAIMAEYERSLSQLTTDAAPELSGVIVSVEAGISRLAVTLRLRLERCAQRIEAAHRRKWATTVNQATGLDISAMIGPGDMRETLGTVIERNVALVSSVSSQAKDRIADSVFRGLAERKPARAVAAEIREAVAMGRARALRISSDQLSKVSETLNEERRRGAGISTWEWISSGKTNYRPEHKARNGKRYDDDATTGEFKPPADRPGQLINCACTSRAVLSVDSEF